MVYILFVKWTDTNSIKLSKRSKTQLITSRLFKKNNLFYICVFILAEFKENENMTMVSISSTNRTNRPNSCDVQNK